MISIIFVAGSSIALGLLILAVLFVWSIPAIEQIARETEEYGSDR